MGEAQGDYDLISVSGYSHEIIMDNHGVPLVHEVFLWDLSRQRHGV